MVLDLTTLGLTVTGIVLGAIIGYVVPKHFYHKSRQDLDAVTVEGAGLRDASQTRDIGGLGSLRAYNPSQRLVSGNTIWLYELVSVLEGKDAWSGCECPSKMV